MTDDTPQQHGGHAAWSALFSPPHLVPTLLVNLGVLLYAIDIFVISTLMPSIVADIGGVAYYAWATMLFVVGAIMGSASYAPAVARLGGRNAFALSGVVFFAGAVVCSMAPSMAVLLVGRFLQGLGAGGVTAGSFGMIRGLFPPELRSRAIATLSFAWILAAILGPLQGGIFGEMGWWRGAYWLYVPVILIFIVGVMWKIPGDLDRGDPEARKRRFPIWRLLMLGGGILCVGLTGRVGSDLLRLGLIVLALGIVWYAFARDAGADNRIFPSRPLSLSEPVGVGFWALLLASAVYTVVAIYMPLVLASVYRLSPIYLGFMTVALSTGWSIGSAAASGLHGGRERVVVIAGPFVMFAGCAGLGTITAFHGSLLLFGPSAFLIGIGIGIFFVHMTVKVMAAARPGEEGITSSSVATIRSVGMAFGAAVAGAVANMAGLDTHAGGEAVRDAVVWVYALNLVPIAAAIAVTLRFVAIDRRGAAAAAAE